jgi:hypothetical protein
LLVAVAEDPGPSQQEETHASIPSHVEPVKHRLCVSPAVAHPERAHPNRLIELLAVGLERWVAHAGLPHVRTVDFPAGSSVYVDAVNDQEPNQC